MKKIVFALLLVSFGTISAQVMSNGAIANSFANQNVFLDASTNNNSTVNDGKGLLFPTTDLTQFTFRTDALDGLNFPSYFDGMIVFNIASGSTNDPALTTQTTGLSRGFYYFSNPTGASTGTLSAGRWIPLGGGSAKFDVTSAETATNTLVASKQVYAIKGTFAATGSSTAVNIPAPTGMTALYGITIYKAGTNTVYDRSLYSYTIATTAGNAITGSPSMSVVYPAGTYDYVIEYLK